MGIHSGPVYRHADIKNELNVVGGGINMAQRVMDCGDAGHILLSRGVADVLGQLTGWADSLHDLGECQVKRGVSVHIYNLCKDGLGNPALPAKIAKLRAEPPAQPREVSAPELPTPPRAAAPLPSEPPPLPPPPTAPLASAAGVPASPGAIPAPRVRRTGILVTAAAVAVVTAAAYLALRTRSPGPATLPQTEAGAQPSPAAKPVAPPAGPARYEIRTNTRDGQPYVWIPAGSFQMGCSQGDRECAASEKPAHEVAISKGFWIGQTEVTQEAYQAAMGVNPSRARGARLPVERVAWRDAQNYCAKAGMRLPTEAEWEYAARGGGEGAATARADSAGWFVQNSGSQPHEVRRKQANAAGLYDMQGNVWEWVADWYGEGYYRQAPSEDPLGPSSGSQRVLRGGSWRSSAMYLRISGRFSLPPDSKDDVLGFRCAGSL